jgi:DNA-directed RNA polymerase II subunit RPB2
MAALDVLDTASKKETSAKYHFSDLRNVIDQFFRSNEAILVQHQLDSFDNFVDQLIPKILYQYNPIVIYGNLNEALGKHEQEIRIKFGEISMHPPMLHENNGLITAMTPEIARLRNLTYSSNLYVHINIETVTWKGELLDIRESKSKNWDNILIGKIPIMVKSRYCCENTRMNSNHCVHDKGGYFIVTGSEKVIISQERQSENKSFCFKSISVPKFSHVVEVKSVPKEGFMPAKTTSIKIATKPGTYGKSIYIAFQGCKKEIPMVILFRALGCLSDKEISYYVFANKSKEMRDILLNMLEASFEESSTILTQESAFDYISKILTFPMSVRVVSTTPEKKIENTKKAIEIDLLPHLGISPVRKCLYLGTMIRKLILYSTERIKDDDRDSFENKRVDTPGIMLGNLLRQSFTKLIKDMSCILTKEINTGVWKMSGDFHNIITVNNIYKIIKSNIIEANVKYSLATGNWGIKNTTAKVGVAQVLQRLSYLGTLSHQRRINTPIDKTSKMTKPRKLHSSTFGYTCPAETPEGAPVGFVKNMALSSNITIAKNESSVLFHITEFEGFKLIEKMTNYKTKHGTIIFLNGGIIGCIANMIELVAHLKNARRVGIIHEHTSIVPNYQERELSVYTSGGRLIRPLFIVKEESNELVFDETHKKYMRLHNSCWDVLVHGNEKENILSAIEYIDVQESNTILVCDHANNLRQGNVESRVRYTHCEIDPSLMLGVLASNIPFSDHNQSPRNCYQAAMGKQAMGVYSTKFRKRLDTLANILWYPGTPMVMTHNSKHLNMHKIPNGSVIIVAIAGDKGYNQEDSLIFNKSSIDRGLFRSSFFRTYNVEEKKNQSTGEEDHFAKPDPSNTSRLRPCNYDGLDDNGFPILNTKIKGGDAIVGKVVPITNKKKNQDTSGKEFQDNSVYLRDGEDGVVDNVYSSRNADGYVFCKVKMRSERTPSIGDKFSSQSAQKGTLGMIYRAEDMPYTKDGIIPDVIMNPHAMPSRMTFAQLLETLLGTECIHAGMRGDGTPFTDVSVEDIAENLEKRGYNKYGEHELFSGETGVKIPHTLFMGPTFYQRLKHMVEDKIHARSQGPIVAITRQSSEGRSRMGGLRVGEMERDVLISHGIAQFQKEKFMELSDNFTVYANRNTGMMCALNKKDGICKSFSTIPEEDDETDNTTDDITELRMPYACKLMFHELLTMGIDMQLKT